MLVKMMRLLLLAILLYLVFSLLHNVVVLMVIGVVCYFIYRSIPVAVRRKIFSALSSLKSR